MPDYIYRCDCKAFITVKHSVKEDPEVPCPDCGKQMKRRPQAIATEFKGTGWGKD
jgi:putative FmdB family regulatory protein